MIDTMFLPGESVTKVVSLDDDVVTEILLRLPSASLLHCRAVCKAWHRITTDPSFLAAHADRYRLDEAPDQLHCPKHCEVGALMGSCDGLLLFQKSRESLFRSDFFVCNPVTKQGARLDAVRLHRHSPSGEHRLLVLANEPELGLPIHYVYSLAAAVTASSQLPRCLGPVADGVVTIHPLAGSTEKILAFDTVSEDFRLISRQPWPREHYRDDDLCLLELDGRLAVTATEFHGDSTELWIVRPPRFSPHWWTGTGVSNVVFMASYTHNFKALYHLTEKRIVKQIEYSYCYLFKDSLVPHSFLNPY
ncbi:hypothetical protein VPH35_074421 [Triticum aestivum]